MQMCGFADVDTGKMRISVRILYFTRWSKIFRHNFSKSQHTALLLLSVAYIRKCNMDVSLVLSRVLVPLPLHRSVTKIRDDSLSTWMYIVVDCYLNDVSM